MVISLEKKECECDLCDGKSSDLEIAGNWFDKYPECYYQSGDFCR